MISFSQQSARSVVYIGSFSTRRWCEGGGAGGRGVSSGSNVSVFLKRDCGGAVVIFGFGGFLWRM